MNTCGVSIVGKDVDTRISVQSEDDLQIVIAQIRKAVGLAQRPEERLKGDALYASHGYALAARVLQSDLYAKLDDRERAECDAMVRGEAPLSPQATPVNTVFVPNPDLMAQKTVDTVARDAARYRFRHSNYVDEDGYEYGYCKVRWKNGSIDSMLWADDEEIDAAMVAASQCGPKG